MKDEFLALHKKDFEITGGGKMETSLGMAVEQKGTSIKNLRLRTWLGCERFRASTIACVCTQCGAMPVGFEPSRSSGRTALSRCAKQRAPLYATHALLWLHIRPAT